MCIIFYIKCNFFFQDCGEFRLYFWIKDYFIYIVFMCFAIVYPYSVDVVEAAPEDHWSCWDMQTRGHHFCCTCVCSSGEYSLYSNCATFFYNALGLNALPVPLLRQVYFFLFLRSFFLVRFLFVFWRSWSNLRGPLDRFWRHLGSIWGSFWCLFGCKVDL